MWIFVERFHIFPHRVIVETKENNYYKILNIN